MAEEFDPSSGDFREGGTEEAAPEAELLSGQDEGGELKEWKEKYLRLLADFDNYRKRGARELDEARKFANESLLRAFLPVVDNLERALDHADRTGAPEGAPGDTSLIEGVRLTHRQFLELLEKNHVTRVESRGVPFDPAFHEAVGFTESAAHPEGTVVDVYQQGYRIHNRLVRPSLVTVSKGPGPGA